MNKSLIQLAYKQIIHAESSGKFEKNVFQDSYSEFLMQAQAYNPENKFKTFQELVENNPKANSLHYKVGFAVGLYIKALNNQIPGLTDSLGAERLRFASYSFEIIASDITNKSNHKVGITYRTDVLTWYGKIGKYLLLATGNKLKDVSVDSIETFMLKMRKNLSIVSLKEVSQCILETAN